MTTHTPAPDDGRTAVGSKIGGRYELRAAIGDGGMGAVWRAHDMLLQRDVAIKEVLLPPELPAAERDTLIERTLREARAAAALSHASVIRVFDVVIEGGRPWIVMELLQARSLADIIKADGPMPHRVVAKIGLSMLGALEAAHQAGILHRDVKPGNVLISADGRCVLSDFGVARTNQPSNLTTPGMVLGSAHYIAPERATGGQIGPASDMFSLGVTLYAAVEGRPPFDRPNALGTMQAVVHDPPESPRRAGPLTPILGGLLDKDPQRRWNVERTRGALQQLMAGSGPLASQAVDGLTDLHRVLPQPQPVSGPPTSAPPVSGAPVSAHPASPGPAPAYPPQPPYEQTQPFTPPPVNGAPQPQHGPYGPPTGHQPGYGPPTGQQPPYGVPPGAPPGPPAAGGAAALLDNARRHVKPWMMAVAAGVIVIALVFGGIAVFGGGDDEPNPGTDPGGNNEPVGPGFETAVYNDPDGIFSVNVPADWNIKPNGKGVVEAHDPNNDDRWIRFSVQEDEGQPKKLIKNAVEGLDGTQFEKGSVEQLAYAEITVAGNAGWMIEYKGVRKNDGQGRHGMWAVFRLDDVNYHIYMSVPEDTFADSKPVFEEAVRSYVLGAG